jgi:DNA-binding CsgD family transcriptional regulator
MARLSRGRVQTERREDASATLQAALRELGDDERPRLRADVHLALAEAERERDVAAAATQARASLAIFERLGARRDADRAAVMLRSLGVSARARADTKGRNAPDVLSRREREVVPLIAEGLSNAEIAKLLFVTPKTIEHHVTNILGRLDLRTRTEIAAWAHRTAAKN